MSHKLSKSCHVKVNRAIALGWDRKTCWWGPCTWLRQRRVEAKLEREARRK